MTERAELAGYTGMLHQAIDPDDLPESFEWTPDQKSIEAPLAEVAEDLRSRIDDPKGAPLALRHRPSARDVLVDVAAVREQQDGFVVILRARAGSGAKTREG